MNINMKSLTKSNVMYEIRAHDNNPNDMSVRMIESFGEITVNTPIAEGVDSSTVLDTIKKIEIENIENGEKILYDLDDE